MGVVREKFSSQADSELLAHLREIAAAEGRQFQSVLDDALREYVDRHQSAQPRRHVLRSLAESVAEFDKLYRALAK